MWLPARVGGGEVSGSAWPRGSAGGGLSERDSGWYGLQSEGPPLEGRGWRSELPSRFGLCAIVARDRTEGTHDEGGGASREASLQPAGSR